MSDEKTSEDAGRGADDTIVQPTIPEPGDGEGHTEEVGLVSVEAEHIGTRDSEAPTKMVALLDPEGPEDTLREVPPPLRPSTPGARTHRRADPPLGAGDRDAEAGSGRWTGTKTVLHVTLTGLGLHAAGDPAAAEAAYLEGLDQLLGGHPLRATGGRVYAAGSTVKAARAAFELLEQLEAEGRSLSPERRISARFGLARGPLGSDAEGSEAAEASAAFRTAVTLGASAGAGEVLASSEVVEDLGTSGVRAERVGKRSVEGLDELIVAHRLLHVDPTLALPSVRPEAPRPAPPAPPLLPGRGVLLVAGAALLLGLGILIGYLLR
ncbi:MAG: hypothetical protein P1V51_01170 [Deltaproteobacteria bacterium]|nr:hypothetical protein [Deltaproteobacteria bacterium]